MKDAWRAVPKLDAPDADDVDGLSPLPHWSMNCPGGRVVVRSRDAVDEFGGLFAVARFLREADYDGDLRDFCRHLRTMLPGESPPTLHSCARAMQFAAKRDNRGEMTVVVYVVNLDPGIRDELRNQALHFLFSKVREAVTAHPKEATVHGVSVVIR